MKKLLLLAFVLLTAVSCTTEEYYETYVNSVTKKYSVKADQWQKAQDELGTYFYYEIKEPSLTSEVYTYGSMNAYISYVLDGQERLSPLPFDDFFVGTDLKWTEQVTCEFRPGYVTFILKYDDQTFDQPSISQYNFLVRFLW